MENGSKKMKMRKNIRYMFIKINSMAKCTLDKRVEH